MFRSFLPALAMTLLAASAASPAFGLRRGPRWLVLLGLGALILPTPLAIDPAHRFARLLAAIWVFVVAAKLYDLGLGAESGRRPGFLAVCSFLVNLSSLVERKLVDEPRPTRPAILRRLAGRLAASIPGALLFAACFWVDWQGVPFAVEHSAKVLAFFVLLVPYANAAVSTYRLLGFPSREAMANPFAATTPADFWRRYNRGTHQFFLEDVFKPLGGARRPALAALGAFAASGLIHEYIFDVANNRVRGFQMAFFLLQGIASVATARLRPRGWKKIPAIAATLVFNLATGCLFFADVDQVLPFYDRRG